MEKPSTSELLGSMVTGCGPSCPSSCRKEGTSAGIIQWTRVGRGGTAWPQGRCCTDAVPCVGTLHMHLMQRMGPYCIPSMVLHPSAPICHGLFRVMETSFLLTVESFPFLGSFPSTLAARRAAGNTQTGWMMSASNSLRFLLRKPVEGVRREQEGRDTAGSGVWGGEDTFDHP